LQPISLRDEGFLAQLKAFQADVQEGKELLAKVSEMTAVIQKKNGAAITVNKKEKPMGRVQNELDIW
ncbi:MAG: hypothetical protein ACFNX0_05405, partial [Treponema sp.]